MFRQPVLICSLTLFLMVFVGVVRASGGVSHSGTVRTVDSVDLQRYIGLWYEIAKVPNRFQRKCDRETTATYSLREDGMIGVVNRCTEKDGNIIETRGVARVVDQASRAKLEVSFVRLFGLQLFWGDYWIVGLDSDYQWAVVGHPDRRYGWVLARSAVLIPDQWTEVKTILHDQGYNPDAFEMTVQTAGITAAGAETKP